MSRRPITNGFLRRLASYGPPPRTSRPHTNPSELQNDPNNSYIPNNEAESEIPIGNNDYTAKTVSIYHSNSYYLIIKP
jgi:hypothetical protein